MTFETGRIGQEEKNLSQEFQHVKKEVLTPEALQFVFNLERNFGNRVRQLLLDRKERQLRIDNGEPLEFLSETREIRESEWKVAPIPADLQDRRVEITGPVERKMIINALNSGATGFMADFEDSLSPTWENLIFGQKNLKDAVDKTITFASPEGRGYRLNEKTAVLMVRPRGWHLSEQHILVDDQPITGALLDFGLFFYHNAQKLIDQGSGPYFYLPKMESYLEARLWNDVFNFAQDQLEIPRGTIRAIALIETIKAVFQMDEILRELKDHSAGLNAGRWDYIFSVIKTFKNWPEMVLPDRSQVTMEVPMMEAYTRLLVQTCHRRGIHAMGGMAAQIPIKNDEVANEAALAKVRKDKLREVDLGHDGTWVAHPGLVAVAKEIFDTKMPEANQLEVMPPGIVRTQDLVRIQKEGTITEQGLRTNIEVGILYLESWLLGNGCVPIKNLMEDAATAEISRAQNWQWLKHGKLEREYVSEVMLEEVGKIINSRDEVSWALETAVQLFTDLTFREDLVEFLTIPAQQLLVS